MGELAERAIRLMRRKNAELTGIRAAEGRPPDLKPPSSPAPQDPILDTPLKDLSEPLAVKSKYLDEVIFLAANEAQAREVERRGGIPYLPREIEAL